MEGRSINHHWPRWLALTPATPSWATLALAALLLVLWPAWSVVEVLVRGAGTDAGLAESTSAASATAASATTNSASTSWVDWGGLARTLVYAGVIGALAAVLGLPGAWVVRRARMGGQSTARHRNSETTKQQDTPAVSLSSFLAVSMFRRLALPLMLAPLLLPNYLAYAGWGVLRGPGSILGDWIARRDPWVSVWAGEAFAVWGLSLWAWPIASLVMGLLLARTSDGVWESLRLEPRSWRVGVERLRLIAPALAAGALTVGLLMTGSAVPLHVAQVQTYTIRLWKQMQVMELPEKAFLGSGPLLLLVVACAWVAVRGLNGRRLWPLDWISAWMRRGVERGKPRREREDSPLVGTTNAAHPPTPSRWEGASNRSGPPDPTAHRDEDHDDDHDDGSAMPAAGSASGGVGRRAWIGLLIVWGMSIPLPLVMFLWSLRQWRALSDFWIVGGPAMLHSLKIGAMVGAGGVILACATCAAGSLARQGIGTQRRAGVLPWGVRLALGVGVVLALVPGVLIGVAFNRAYALNELQLWGGEFWRTEFWRS